MAYTTQTHAGLTLANRWANFRADLVEAHAKRKLYRVTKAELSNLTNRDLADLGINRSMINRLALEAAGYI